MGYSLTTSLARPSARSHASPKTHVPGSRLQERGHRYYNPEMGRWIGRTAPAFSTANNASSFAWNDPLGQVADDTAEVVLELNAVALLEDGVNGGGEWKCFEDDGENPSRDSDAKPLPKDKRVVNNNRTCTAPCTKAHEAQHEEDMGSCCEKAQAAWEKAKQANDKTEMGKIKAKWRLYRRGNSIPSECRAWGVSKKCGRDLWRDKCNCPDASTMSKKEFSCCVDVGVYFVGASSAETDFCNKSKKVPPERCTF